MEEYCYLRDCCWSNGPHPARHNTFCSFSISLKIVFKTSLHNIFSNPLKIHSFSLKFNFHLFSDLVQLKLFHSFLAEYLIGTKCCRISLAPNDFAFIVLWDDLIWISNFRKRHQIVNFTTALKNVIAAEFYGIWETLLLDFHFTANCDKICNGTQLLILNSVTKSASSILHIRPRLGLGFQWACMQVTHRGHRPVGSALNSIRCRWTRIVSCEIAATWFNFIFFDNAAQHILLLFILFFFENSVSNDNGTQ